MPIPDRFVPQTIRKAVCLTLNKAGIKSAISRTNENTGVIIPAMARPFPVILPPDFSILTRAIIPRIIAGIPVRIPSKKLMMPRTRAAIAMPLVLDTIGSASVADGVSVAPQALQD